MLYVKRFNFFGSKSKGAQHRSSAQALPPKRCYATDEGDILHRHTASFPLKKTATLFGRLLQPEAIF